ncbi:ABC transporter permease family protein [Staphylococcus felis]|uniref:heme ABC transporter permease n=1 Tax=Staphylococcus felis TaxID=46127 RepID=UPI000E21F7B2|nr:heme ABC transporter permease [Staphylococcus felis]REH79657.1 heme ABC transporter permease [Staphylococcus felis]
MKIALSELKFYKFKYLLITFIVVLLASMVLFITGLAQGLARENISLLDAFKSEQFVIQKGVDQQLEKSNIGEQQAKNIEQLIDKTPLKLSMATAEYHHQNGDLIFATIPKGERPSLQEGHLPSNNQEVTLNSKLKGEGLKIGDQITIKDQDKTLKIVGFFDDAMYSHTNIAMVNNQGLNDITKDHAATSLYFLNGVSKQTIQDIKAIDDVEVVTKEELTNAIPSYQAEQAPLTMMIVSLFVITAIVLTALMFQILFVTMIGVLLSLGLIVGLSMMLPVTMPFHITSQIMLFVVVIFIVVAIIGALLSLVRVFKIDPIEAIGGKNV